MFCAKLLLDDIMLLLNTGHPFAKLLNMKGPAFSRNILFFCLIWIDADLHHIILGGSPLWVLFRLCMSLAVGAVKYISISLYSSRSLSLV